MDPARGGMAPKLAHRMAKGIEGRDETRRDALPQRGQPDAMRPALEQDGAIVRLQRLDLGGDGPRRHHQLVRRLPETAKPRRRLEGAQGVQGRHPAERRRNRHDPQTQIF